MTDKNRLRSYKIGFFDFLKQMGYTNATDIGGIADYYGKVER